LNNYIDCSPDIIELYLERGGLNIDRGDFRFHDCPAADEQRMRRQRFGTGAAAQEEGFVRRLLCTARDTEGASTEQARAAYKKLASVWYRDRFSNCEKRKDAESMMQKLQVHICRG
jgi:hypothetical protein